MKKIILLACLVLAGSPAAFAVVKKKKVLHTKAAPTAQPASTAKIADVSTKKTSMSSSLQAWLKDMKRRVTKTAARPNQLVAVAAVRGDETPDSPPLYWKGKKAEGKVESAELREFEAAVDAALGGDTPAAKEKLQAFVQAYPKSSLASDAQATLGQLNTDTVTP